MAKTKRFPIAPKLKGVEPPGPGGIPFETKIKVSEGARESILWSSVAARYFFLPLVDARLEEGFDFEYKGKGPIVNLRRPVTTGDLQEAWAASVALTDPERAKTVNISPRGPNSIACRSFSYLSSTSKMGCWSFNLLAGPPDLGGACPAATPGFMFSPPEKQQQARRMLRVEPSSIRTDDYLCSGCYALKGKYGTPSTILFQAFRHRMTLLLLRNGAFVERTIRAIRHGQALARKERAATPARDRWATKHPDYFRIHDSGDFFEDTYTRAWLEIIRALPNIHFWAPTRMFALKGGASTTFRKHGIPPNLALRPSGLHFGEAAPPVVNPGTPAAVVYGEAFPGVAAGSGAVKKGTPAQGWICPATAHWTQGGGAQATKRDDEHRGPKPKVPSYTCGLAHGPNSPFYRAEGDPDEGPEGAGCRVCWKYKSVAVYYGEH